MPMGFPLHQVGVLFFPLGFLLQGIFPLFELGGHCVERLGELAQIGNGLGIIALGHLLGLPGQMVRLPRLATS